MPPRYENLDHEHWWNATQSRLAKGLVNDLGDGYEASFEQDDDGCDISINKCLYKTILEDAGKPHLLKVCCCSQDASWCASDAASVCMLMTATVDHGRCSFPTLLWLQCASMWLSSLVDSIPVPMYKQLLRRSDIVCCAKKICQARMTAGEV